MTRLLFFEAPWCPTCHQVKPLLSATAQAAGIPVRYLNVALHEDMLEANRYFVRVLPTLIVLNDGQPKCSLVGSSIAKWRPD